MDPLFEQLRSAVDRLSGLTQALGDTATTVDHDPLPVVSADRIDDAFASVAGAARLELLEVRPEVPRRPVTPATPRPGVHHRLIVDSRVADAVDTAAWRDTEIRTAELLPVRAVVADREALALAVGLTHDTGCLLTDRHSETAARFAARFLDVWWPRAHPYAPAATAAEAATEAAVIAGLAQGLTDESVARRVGVTPRTVRRHVAAVSARFGATSRLQLGVLIGRSAQGTVTAAPNALDHG